MSSSWGTITPESAEVGDYEDQGVDRDEEPFSRLSDVVRAVKNDGWWANWSGNPAGPDL